MNAFSLGDSKKIYHKGKEIKEFLCDEADRLILEEFTDYIIEGSGLSEIPNLVSLVKKGNESEPDIAEINFRNYVGTAQIFGRECKIKSKKIEEHQFNEMLTRISSVISNLPFDFNTPTFLPFDRSSISQSDVFYQKFAYLRHIVLYDSPNLEAQFRAIESDPHRTIVKVSYEEDISRVRKVGVGGILNMFSKGEQLLKVHEGASVAFNYPVAIKMMRDPSCKIIPTVIPDERIEITFDNPENRFVKAFIKNSLLFCEHFGVSVKILPEHNRFIDIGRDVLWELEEVVRVLDRLLKAGFLTDVGDLQNMPSNSQVLQKMEGYRQVFMHYHRMTLASQFPIDHNSLKQIIENKDIATLYEYWCFFTIACILGKKLGKVKCATIGNSDEFKKELKHGIKLSFPGDIELFYNKSYPGNSKNSYSVTLRPDITLKVRNTLHLFDAKFKYDEFTFQDEGNIDELEQEEIKYQKFKLGDLYKMHTYRDAIKGAALSAVDVWILYPGKDFKFYEVGKGKIDSIREIGCFDGVGAVPLRPLCEADYLEDLMSRILEITE